MSELEAKVENLYRDWIYNQNGTFSKNDALTELLSDIVDVISGADKEDLNGVARSTFDKVDKKLTAEGDKLIRKQRDTGAIPLDLGRHDALVALGNGKRIKFGYMGLEDFVRAKELRYKNVRDAQNAFDEWLAAWEPYLPYLSKGMIVRDVDFEEPPEDGGSEDPSDDDGDSTE